MTLIPSDLLDLVTIAANACMHAACTQAKFSNDLNPFVFSLFIHNKPTTIHLFQGRCACMHHSCKCLEHFSLNHKCNVRGYFDFLQWKVEVTKI